MLVSKIYEHLGPWYLELSLLLIFFFHLEKCINNFREFLKNKTKHCRYKKANHFFNGVYNHYYDYKRNYQEF